MGVFKWVVLTVLLAVLVVFYGPPNSPAQAPGPYPELYKVTLLRAAPGKLSDLIDFLVQQKKDGYYAALAGQHDALLGERVMENHYLIATGRNPNLIFTGDVGSDFDSFTIGFYPSMKEFAAPAPVSDQEADRAAIAAGFEGRSSIGFYLREFLSYHHDTLATKVE